MLLPTRPDTDVMSTFLHSVITR
ncbi:hypothetical protein Gogos_005594 [Gossypium gossypioides]|uniref:Uncharacterized protein n=1 Tax=Gossypium gossypioides TaxID=34282 RepID=A0A7J9D4P7_GOSGO|nr:hypothetical protein [Gossypium gossypioides]